MTFSLLSFKVPAQIQNRGHLIAQQIKDTYNVNQETPIKKFVLFLTNIYIQTLIQILHDTKIISYLSVVGSFERTG